MQAPSNFAISTFTRSLVFNLVVAQELGTPKMLRFISQDFVFLKSCRRSFNLVSRRHWLRSVIWRIP